MSEGIILILSGPSGVGKGTIVNSLITSPEFYRSISITTRKPRPDEEEGIHYFFRTAKEFSSMIANDEFLEYAKFCGNDYGTPKDNVYKQLAEGVNVILEIDVQGALKVKEKIKDAVSIFIVPPSIKELKRRLYERDTEDDVTIQNRINRALEEFSVAEKYDYIVVNNNLDEAISDIEEIVYVEKHLRSARNKNLLQSFKN